MPRLRSLLRLRRSPSAGERTAGANQFDAFVSYSHAVDGRLAPALQSALQRFSKPWYRLRALRVFLDNASLSANPGLWGSIERALENARWFVLLASPVSASSPWVAREVESWLARRGTERLLIALTDGDLVWDATNTRFAAGTPLPSALLAAFDDEPRFVDLRWARSSDHLSRSDPRFQDAVADLAAPIHGRPKDELVGNEVRQHRRAVRLARAAIATLTALLVAVAIAALFALNQRNVARAERDRAEAQARLATSRQLAADATRATDLHHDLALLLAVEAFRTRATPEARNALDSTLRSNPKLVAFLGASIPRPGPDPGPVAFAPAGGFLAVAEEDGITLRDAGAGRVVRRLASSPPAASIRALEFSADGTLVAAGGLVDGVTVWETRSGRVRKTLTSTTARLPASLTFAPNGRLLAVGYKDPAPAKQRVVIWDLPSGSVAQTFSTQLVDDLAFDRTGRWLQAGSVEGKVVRFPIGDVSPPSASAAALGPIRQASHAYSADGGLYAVSNFEGNVGVYDALTGALRYQFQGERSAYDAMAFSGDGRTLAVAGEGGATIWRLDQGTRLIARVRGFGGSSSHLALNDDGSRLAIVGRLRVALYDLQRVGRLVEEVRIPDVYLPPSVARIAHVAFSADGRRLAWLHPGTIGDKQPAALQRAIVWDVSRHLVTADVPLQEPTTALALSPDGRTLAVGGETVDLYDLSNRTSRRFAPGAGEFVDQLRFSRDGLLLTVARRDGATVRYDVRTRAVRSGVPATFPPTTIALSADGEQLALGEAGTGTVTLTTLAGAKPQTRTISGGANGIANLAFSPAGALAFGFELGQVNGDTPSGDAFTFDFQRRATSVVFAPDGRHLAIAGADGLVLLWDVETERAVAQLRVQDLGNEPIELAMRPRGEPLVAIATVDGALTLWRPGTASSLQLACAIARRNLTRQEWQQHVGTIRPYTKTCVAYSAESS